MYISNDWACLLKELWIWKLSPVLTTSKIKLSCDSLILLTPQVVSPFTLITSSWTTIIIGAWKACHFIVFLPFISYPHSCSPHRTFSGVYIISSSAARLLGMAVLVYILTSCYSHILAGTWYFLTLSFLSIWCNRWNDVTVLICNSPN